MSITCQPASSFPATDSHGNPAGVAAISDQTCARTAARTRATLSRVRGSASSSVRRTVVSLGSGPRTGAWWASRVMSFILVAPSAIATAMETSAMPRSTSGNFPARARADPSAAVSPAWSASLRSTAPACPARPSPSPVTFSAWSQPVSCMTKSAPAWGFEWCGYRVISQNRGALRYLDTVRQTAVWASADPAGLSIEPDRACWHREGLVTRRAGFPGSGLAAPADRATCSRSRRAGPRCR